MTKSRNIKKAYVEIADTPSKREKGLMYRKKLFANHGMLFKYPYSSVMSFWGKNTYIPLDIAFIDGNGIIKQISEITPLNLKSVSSNDSCKYAMEMSKGWFSSNGIRVGCRINFGGISKTAQMAVDETMGDQGVPQPQVSNPEVVLNKSFKDTIEDANNKGRNLIIIYQTKDGLVLPPKQLIPPFTFEEDADGKKNSILKAWDNQTGSWKSFLIDNIMDLNLQKE